MNNTEQQDLGVLNRAIQFDEEYPRTPAIPRATELFAEAASLKTQLLNSGVTQALGRGGYRGGAAERRILAKEVRTILVDMAATARSLDPDHPGMAEQFRLGNQAKSHQKLLVTAQMFVTAVEPPEVKALFTARAYPADFDTQLTAKTTALAAALNRKDVGLQGQKLGTAGMEVLHRKVMKTMRELRALMVKNLRETDPALLEVWKAAARVYRGSAKPPVVALTPAATPAPSGGGSPSVAS